MTDTLFIQFREGVHKTTGISQYDYDWDLICNGFSLVHDSCKRIGDFLWIDGGDDPRRSGVARDEMKSNYGYNVELPIKKGVVYVSAFYARQLLQSLCWAQMYPEVDFVVGGPAVIRGFEYMYNGQPINDKLNTLFSNFRVTTELAEKEIFGEPIPRREWTVELPKELLKYPRVILNYPVERGCYWNKCLFCQELPSYGDPCASRYKNGLEHLQLTDESHNWIVWLAAEALYPDFIRDWMPLLPDGGISFFGYVRSDDMVLDALESIEIPKNITLHTGLECASNRVLKQMRKGSTTSQYLRFLRIVSKINTEIQVSAILGWNLIDEDLVEAEAFCREAASITPNIYLIVTKLIYNSTKAEELHEVLEHPEFMYTIMDEVGEFAYVGMTPIWGDEIQKRNDELAAIYSKYLGNNISIRGDRDEYDK